MRHMLKRGSGRRLYGRLKAEIDIYSASQCSREICLLPVSVVKSGYASGRRLEVDCQKMVDSVVVWSARRRWNSVAKFRKLGWKVILTKCIYILKNRNYIPQMVLSLSNHWPSNNSTSFNGHVCKNNKQCYHPLFFKNVHKTLLSQIKIIISPEMFSP